MKFVIENIEIELPTNLSSDMNEEEFLHFCEQNKDLRIERNADKQIFITSPVNSYGGGQNASISFEVAFWNKQTNAGVCFDSSTGFTLPDGSMLSPDCSWMPLQKWNSISKEDQQKFAPLCPDFIIELKSKTDRIKILQHKMVSWIENGAKLCWLIDTEAQLVYIYRADGTVTKIEGFNNKLSGEDVLVGFELDLNLLLK